MAKPKKRTDPMDGAYFTYSTAKGDTPADYMNGPDGRRPGEKDKPSGSILIDIKWSVGGKTLPPRSVWEKGRWAAVDSSQEKWDVWIVSGEGTPGNYEHREYRVPESQANKPTPDHPADWSKKEKGGSWSGSSYSSSPKKTSSGLPYGLRVRCPNCGHFYKMDDLPGHTKSACPAGQTQPAMWVIECECHPNDLQTAATVLPGFPVKPPEAAPDKSGEDGKAKPKAAAKKQEPVKA